MRTRGTFIILMVIALFVALFGFFSSDVWSMGSRPQVSRMPAVEFSLNDLNGKGQIFAEYRNKKKNS